MADSRPILAPKKEQATFRQFLQFPYLVQQMILKRMTTYEQLAFSLLSKRAKRAIKSLRRTTDKFEASLEYGTFLNFKLDTKLRHCLKFSFPRKSTKPFSTPIAAEPSTHHENSIYQHSLARSDLCFQKWLKHLMEVYHCTQLELTINDSFFDSPIEDVWHDPQVSHLIILERASQKTMPILKTFPSVEKLCLYRSPCDESDEMLSHDCKDLLLGASFQVDVEGITKIKAETVRIFWPTFYQEGLNAFLKKWISGSNPNLKSMAIRFKRNYFDESFWSSSMEGIPYEVGPIDQEPPFFQIPFERSDSVDAVYIVENVSGKKAKVLFDRQSIFACFKFVILE